MKKQIAKSVSNSSIRPILKCVPRDSTSSQDRTLKQNLELTIKDPRSFVLSQWTNSPIPYIVYRSVVALLMMTASVYLCIFDKKGDKILIYLTYWSFFNLTACNIVQTVSCWYYFTLRLNGVEGNFAVGRWRNVIKAQWVLYYISTVSAPVVALLYWTLRATSIYFENFTTHATTVIYLMIDIFITRTPVRLYHVYITMIYGMAYGVFSMIYWASGGTNHKGEHRIYKQIDYGNNPAIAVGYIIALCVLAVPISHFFIYVLYRIRVHIFHKHKICERTGSCPMSRKTFDENIPRGSAEIQDDERTSNFI